MKLFLYRSLRFSGGSAITACQKEDTVLDSTPAWTAAIAGFQWLLSDGYKICKWLLVAGKHVKSGKS